MTFDLWPSSLPQQTNRMLTEQEYQEGEFATLEENMLSSNTSNAALVIIVRNFTRTSSMVMDTCINWCVLQLNFIHAIIL